MPFDINLTKMSLRTQEDDSSLVNPMLLGYNSDLNDVTSAIASKAGEIISEYPTRADFDNMIAPAFSINTIYQVGDYCRYLDNDSLAIKLYKFINPHYGNWSYDDVEEIILTTDVMNLNNKTNNFEMQQQENLYNKINIPNNIRYAHTIISSNGNLISSTDGRCACATFIPVIAGSILFMTDNSTFNVAMYSSNSQGTMINFRENSNTTFYITDNCYLRFTIFNKNMTANNYLNYIQNLFLLEPRVKIIEDKFYTYDKLNVHNLLQDIVLYTNKVVNDIKINYNKENHNFIINYPGKDSVSIMNLFGGSSDLTDILIPNNQYYLKINISDIHIQFQLVFYLNNSLLQKDAIIRSYREDSIISVPQNCTGIIGRLRIESTEELNNIILSEPLITNVADNKMISEQLPIINGFVGTTLLEKWETKNNMPYIINGAGTTVPANTQLIGLPYSDARYSYNDLFYNRSPYSFYTALCNPAADIYIKRGGELGSTGKACYWGAICSSWVSWFTGQDMLYVEDEIENVCDFFDYHNIGDLQVGDILIKGLNKVSGHVMVITDFHYDQAGRITAVQVCDMAESKGFRARYLTPDYINSLYKYRGGEYYFCRFPHVHTRKSAAPKPYNSHIMSQKGNCTWFKLGEPIYLYVDNITDYPQLYYKSEKDTAWNIINFLSLPQETIEDIIVYNVTSLFNDTTTYYYTTDENSYINELQVVDVGQIILDPLNEQFSLVNFSDNIYPAWYQLFLANSKYQASSINDDNIKYINKSYVNNTLWYGGTQQNNTQQKFKGTYTNIPFDMTQVDDYIGKWIRIYYNTNYGYTVLDSQILLH